MTRRRGQAALEFLSTYGFAFLLILVMIGALSYFGILNPQKFLPGRCLISNEFTCSDRVLVRNAATGGLWMNFTVINNLGSQITFQNDATMFANATYGNGGCTAQTASIISGGRSTINCTLLPTSSAFPAVGEKVKVAYVLTYKALGGDYVRAAAGEIADSVQ